MVGYNCYMELNSRKGDSPAWNGVMMSPGKIRLKFVPSRARYYMRCPYFLYLSNNKEIRIPYPQIASRKGYFFEGIVLKRISEETGYEISKAAQVTDLLSADGLYILNKRVDTEFYAEKNVGFKVGMLRPDLILSEKAKSSVQITIMEIKNSDCLRPYHYLQAYIYKLALERFLSQRARVPVHVAARMIHPEKGFYPEDGSGSDFEIFRERTSALTSTSLVVRNFINLESEISLNETLRKIASLQPNTAECDTCPGADECDHGKWDGLEYK